MELCGDHINQSVSVFVCQKPKIHALPHRAVGTLYSNSGKQTIVVVEWGDAQYAEIRYPVTPREVEPVIRSVPEINR